MPVTNDQTTGATSVCQACGSEIEQALLLRGLMIRDRHGRRVPSPGIPTWRRLDRGPGSARCYRSDTARHVPAADASGTAFKAPTGASLPTGRNPA